MRTIKTALAVSLAIFVSQVFKLKSPFFVGIAAIISMKSSVSESLTAGKSRTLGTIFGAIVAIIFAYIAPRNILSIAIGIIVIIYVCNMLGWKNAVHISSIVFLNIMLNYEEGNMLSYALYRTVDTLIGLVIGTIINYVLVPPENYYERLLKDSIRHMYYQIKKDMEDFFWNHEKVSLEKLKDFLTTTREDYKTLNEDIKLKIGKSDSIGNFKTNLNKTINSIENIYINLSIIFQLDSIPALDEDNRSSLEKLFKKELPYGEVKDNSQYVIYNFHVKNIIEELKTLDRIIGSNKEE